MLAGRPAISGEVTRLLGFDARLAANDGVLQQKLLEVLPKVNRGGLGSGTEKIPVKSVHDESSSTMKSASQTTPR